MKGSTTKGNKVEEGSHSGKRFDRLNHCSDIENRNLSLTDDDPDLLGEEEASPTPYNKSPWSAHMNKTSNDSSTKDNTNYSQNVLMGSLVREEGHIYSLAASGDLLYTCSDSKNIRIWKKQNEFSGFKSNSGLVKAIIIANEKIFTGHQHGKIRVWRVSHKKSPIVEYVVVAAPLGRIF